VRDGDSDLDGMEIWRMNYSWARAP
jgi:hypothetical protein